MPFFCCGSSSVVDDEPRGKPRASSARSAPTLPSIVVKGQVTRADLLVAGRAMREFAALSAESSVLESAVRAQSESFVAFAVAAHGSGDSDEEEGDDGGNDGQNDSDAVQGRASQKPRGLEQGVLLAEPALLRAVGRAFATAKRAASSDAASKQSRSIGDLLSGDRSCWALEAPRDGARIAAPSGPFVTMRERAELLGFKERGEGEKTAATLLARVAAAASLLMGDVVRAVAVRLAGTRGGLHDAVRAVLTSPALRRLEPFVDACRGDSSVAAAFDAPTPLGVVAQCVHFALQLLCVAGGGPDTIFTDDLRPGGADDAVLHAALAVPAISSAISLLRFGCYNPSVGMHAAGKVSDDLEGVRALLAALGALDHSCRRGGEGADWMRGLPLFAISDDARAALMYVWSAANAQRSMRLMPVLRSDFVTSAIAAVKKATGASNAIAGLVVSESADGEASRKLFPLFAKEGVGLESGEGHGPRKEFFEAVGFAMTSSVLPEIELTAAAEVTLLRPREAAKKWQSAAPPGCAAVVLRWRRVRVVAEFSRGDTLIFEYSSGDEPQKYHATIAAVLPRRREAARRRRIDSIVKDSSTGDDSDSEGTGERAAARGADDAATVALAINGVCPFEPDQMTSLSVARAARPPFVHEQGRKFALFNGALNGDQVGATAATFAFVGWALGNAVANGVVVPAALPPLLFQLLRLWAAAPGDHGSKGALWDASSQTTPLRVARKHIALLDEGLRGAVEDVQRMSLDDFRVLLESEGLLGEGGGTSAGNTCMAAEAQRDRYIDDVLVVELAVPSELRGNVQLLAEGFASSGAYRCPVFTHATARQLQQMFCGVGDDGVSNFEFADQFVFMWDSSECAPHAKHPQARAFADILLEVMDTALDARTKRRLLRFVTGTAILPPRRHAEHIKLEFPLSPMTAPEFDAALARLPSSHSCDNVLELPNYMDAALFGSDGIYRALVDANELRGVVLERHREECWGALNDRQRGLLRREVSQMLQRKLTQAVLQSDTYELDEITIDERQRKLFDACFAPVASPPPSPSPPVSSRDCGGRPMRHAAAPSPGSDMKYTASASPWQLRDGAPLGHGGTHHRLESLRTVSSVEDAELPPPPRDEEQTEPQQPQPQPRTGAGADAPRREPSPIVAPRSASRPGEDIDELMSELFPAKAAV